MRSIRTLDAVKTTETRKLRITIRTLRLFNFILVVILLFYRIIDCATSAMRTKYGEHFYNSGKICEMVEIADECVESINGNCATDAGFSGALSQLQRECDQEKSGFCTENHQHMYAQLYYPDGGHLNCSILFLL